MSKHVQGICTLLIVVSVCSLAVAGCFKFDNEQDVPDSPTGVEIPEPTPTPFPPGMMIAESLKNGQTGGYYENASFTAEGLQFHGGEAFLRYSIPTTPGGYIEFSAKGFEHDELHGGSEFKSMLFSMWSGDHAYMYETAPYIYELRKFGAIHNHPAANAFDLRFIVAHDWNHGERAVLFWDPNVTYRFRIEWGHGVTSVYRDGQLAVRATYHGDFAPSNHQIQIGANLLSSMPNRRREAPHNILVSDVLVCTL